MHNFQPYLEASFHNFLHKMAENSEKNVVHINKNDKKIVVSRRKPAPATVNLPPPLAEKSKGTAFCDESPPFDFPAKNLEISALQPAAICNDSKEEGKATAMRKMSSLERLKSLDFSTPKIDVNIFASSPVKKPKLEGKQQKQHQEQPINVSDGKFSQMKKFDEPKFLPRRDDRPRNLLEGTPSNHSSRNEHPRGQFEEISTRFSFRGERHARQKPGDEATPSFSYDDMFGDDSGRPKRNRDFSDTLSTFTPPSSDHRQSSFPSRPSDRPGDRRLGPRHRSPRVGAPHFNIYGGGRRGPGRSVAMTFGRASFTAPRRLLAPSTFTVESVARQHFTPSSEGGAFVERDFKQNDNYADEIAAEPPSPRLSRLPQEKLDALLIQPNDLNLLSLQGLKNTTEYLCEINKDLHYKSTRLANQIGHINNALACCPRRNLTDEEVEALLSKNVEVEHEKDDVEPKGGFLFQSTICEETFAKALCSSIYDQAEARRRALIVNQPPFLPEVPLESVSNKQKCIQSMQSFFSGLASGMVEKIRYEDSVKIV